MILAQSAVSKNRKRWMQRCVFADARIYSSDIRPLFHWTFTAWQGKHHAEPLWLWMSINLGSSIQGDIQHRQPAKGEEGKEGWVKDNNGADEQFQKRCSPRRGQCTTDALTTAAAAARHRNFPSIVPSHANRATFMTAELIKDG